MRTIESSLQQACIRIFRIKYRQYSNRLFAIPNGGKRSKVTAHFLKMEGVLPGVSDLFLSIPKDGYGGMFIEMKGPGGSLSDYQKEFINAHQEDYKCIVVRSVEQFLKEIEAYLEKETV